MWSRALSIVGEKALEWTVGGVQAHFGSDNQERFVEIKKVLEEQVKLAGCIASDDLLRRHESVMRRLRKYNVLYRSPNPLLHPFLKRAEMHEEELLLTDAERVLHQLQDMCNVIKERKLSAFRRSFICVVETPEDVEAASTLHKMLRSSGSVYPLKVIMLHGLNTPYRLVNEGCQLIRLPANMVPAHAPLHSWSLSDQKRVFYLSLNTMVLKNIDRLFEDDLQVAHVRSIHEPAVSYSCFLLEPDMWKHEELLSMSQQQPQLGVHEILALVFGGSSTRPLPESFSSYTDYMFIPDKSMIHFPERLGGPRDNASFEQLVSVYNDMSLLPPPASPLPAA